VIEVLLGALRTFSFNAWSDDLTELGRGIQQAISAFSQRLAARSFQDFTAADRPGEDHGVVAAEHLTSLLAHIRKNKPGVRDYTPAIAAISAHNCQRRRVRFADQPLSFLLILCDTLQEWNRPHLLYTLAPATVLSRLFYEHGLRDEQDVVEATSIELPSVAGEPLGFELRYTEDIHSNCGLFHLWLDASSNLQRLDPDGFPFDVTVKLTSPAYRVAGQDLWQMERLRQAAYETHMNFLADWFPRAGNDAVGYSNKEQAGYEHVTLNLRALCAAHPITASMSTFSQFLKRWRHFNQDQVFQGDYASTSPG
jgi:hypothetical protein